MQKGLLSAGGKYGRYKLTARAFEILRNKTPISGFLSEQAETPLFGKITAAEYDQALFEILRKERKELADAAQVPPYVIFSDKTLAEMAYYFPMSEHSLKSVNGVGIVKFERYGAKFLRLIREYCQPRNLIEKPHQAANRKSQTAKPALSARAIKVSEAFNAGRSAAELAAESQVSPNTILQYLTEYALYGNDLRQSEGFLAMSRLQPAQQMAVLEAFKKLGAQRLKPVFEELGGKITWDELKILRLHHLCSSKP